MKTTTFLLLLAAQGVRAQTAVPGVPPLKVELSDEAREVKAGYVWKLGEWTLAPTARVGELAPQGSITSAMPTTMTRSPYFGGGVQAIHHGGYEAMILTDVSRATLNSSKTYADRAASASPASHGIDTFSEPVRTFSTYVDAGKVANVSGRVRAAVYGAVETWVSKRGAGGPYGTVGMMEFTSGGAVLARTGHGELLAHAQLRMQGANKDRFNNGQTVLVPSVAGGAEYALPVKDLRAAAGVEATTQRADVGVRPYLSLGSERIAAIIAAEARKSRDPFYPDSKGAAIGLRATPVSGVNVSVEARMDRKSYALAPQPVSDFTVSGQVSVDLSHFARVTAGQRARARAAKTPYTPADSRVLNGRMASAEYRSMFDKALRESATFEEFAAKIPAQGMDGVLATVAAFTDSFGIRNYNNDAPDVKNLEDMGELYRRGRESYLTGDHDGTLICIGSAQFAANLARALGERAGVPIMASAVSVNVPGGHAVTAIRTPEYGIVFADWGRLTPTGTQDTKEALAVYQALQGMPDVYHEITSGPTGRPVGYLFSDEGKALVRRLTFHGDAGQAPLARMFEDVPRGSDVAAERYKALLRAPR
jgi:hypothetical protein